MAPLNPLPFREVRRRLIAAGFAVHSRRGSHIKFVKVASGHTRTVIVPEHREIATGTLRSIIRQAGLSTDEFSILSG
ncbi:MAG: type II toxin-antitoxin system HicA family toxin [SAR202 cluster bacterium]|nr:type II toxin-antitoxin system HicA family toxin [SAR202 cluster bacterium]